MSGIAPRIDTIESQVAVAGVTYIGNASGESGTTGYTVYSERKTFTVTIATPGVFTVTAHGYSDGDAVSLSTTGALPTGLAANTVYYVVNKATNTFRLSTTLGGSAIATSGTQSGVHTIGPVVAHVGTGGVAAGTTFTVSNINPLRGLQSFIFSKDAANRMGEGVSYNFTIDRADLAKVLTVGFEYQVISGTLNDGDVRVYLIQDPNGVPSIIQPAGLTVMGATAGVKMKHVATFQSDFTAREYRLCIHVASTNVSAWSLGVDSISVGPQQKLYGAPITDWVSYTPASIVGLSSQPTYEFSKYRRVGGSLEINFEAIMTGAQNSVVRIPMPPGFTFDKANWSSSGSATLVRAGGASSWTGVLVDDSLNNFLIESFNTGYWQTGVPTAFAAGDSLSISVMVPVVGLSSSVSMSQDTDTRVVAAQVRRATGQSIAATSTWTKVLFNSSVIDTHSSFDITTNNRYNVPVSGQYRLYGQFYWNTATANTGDVTIGLYKNGSIVQQLSVPKNGTAAVQHGTPFSFLVQSNAGDYLEIYVNQAVVASYTIAGDNTASGLSQLSIERLSGPSAIAASETVGFNAASNAGDIIGTSDSLIKFTSIEDNTHGAYSASTGLFTAPVSGRYSASWLVSTQAVLLATNQRFASLLYKNGSSYRNGQRMLGNGVSNIFASGGSVQDIRLNAGDTLSIYAVSSVATNANAGAPEPVYFSVIKTGN